MLQTALAQVRTHYRRLVAVSLAILIAVAFFVATQLLGNAINSALGATLAANYQNSDVVLSEKENRGGSPGVGQQDADRAVSLPSVEHAYPVKTTYVQLGADAGNGTYARLTNIPPAHFSSVKLTEGREPSADGEITLDEGAAASLKLAVGSTVNISYFQEVPAPPEAVAQDPALADMPAFENRNATATVVGITKPSDDPTDIGTAVAYATSDQVNAWSRAGEGYRFVALSAKEGQAGQLLQEAKDAVGSTATVRTTADEIETQFAAVSQGTIALQSVLWTFVAIALAVAAMVISNTFNVLIAQRTRELALLRCVGATTGQVRNSVLVEALVTGLVASLAGVAAAFILMLAVVGVGKSMEVVPQGTEVTLEAWQALVGILLGVALTVVSAYFPARNATRVAPLAALRPLEEVTGSSLQGKLRISLGLVMFVGGMVALLFGAVMPQPGIAVAGGLASFLGLVVAAPLIVPACVKLFGRLVSGRGVPGRLAALNSVRNPRRTSTTATALLVGVTLVTTIMSAAATAQSSSSASLSENFPIDISIDGSLGSPDGSAQAFTEQDLALVREVEGVEKVMAASVATVNINGQDVPVAVGDPAGLASVSRNQGMRAEQGALLASSNTRVGGEATFTGPLGTGALPVKKEDLGFSAGFEFFLTPQDAARFVEVPPASVLWIKVEDSVATKDALKVQEQVAQALGVSEQSMSGAIAQKAQLEQIISVMLAVVVGLLAVAVLIALIGVANTISLSVLERTRESSMLRALGLTKGQLRGMFAMEAVLIAGVAGIIGTVLGTVYGVSGAYAILSESMTIVPTVPWLQLLGVLLVAFLAGLLASVVPGRRAARLSPVEGLATV